MFGKPRLPASRLRRIISVGERGIFGWFGLASVLLLLPGDAQLAEPPPAHWAFQPILSPVPPSVLQADWPRNTIDRFLLARMEASGLRPAPDAAPQNWLRRVTFDLTGLPPDEGEAARFLSNPSTEAREKVVDKLLTSPAFGERWARHWLDLVGYADQLGTVNDVPAPYAWRYRDYVVQALNSDKPFDRFVHEQIAGDLMPLRDARERQEAIIATGFLLLGEIHIVTGDKAQLKADIVDHQIQKIGASFLGQSLGCVRCHDHKFDPIRLEDYYGMAGIFNSTESSFMTDRGVWSSILVSELPEPPEDRLRREESLARHLAQVEKIRSERAALSAELSRVKTALSQASTNAPTASTSAEKNGKPRQAELEKQLGQLQTRLHHLAFIAPKASVAYAVRESSEPADGPIHQRGNPRTPGRVVPRGFIRVVQTDPPPAIPPHASGRLELAQWLTQPRHPLTSRVLANRLWKQMMGEGLVRSVDYFGTRGDPPVHPGLLDYLAQSLIHGNWSQKRILREIALSRTYAQACSHDPGKHQADPDNRLWSRMPSRRLDAESLRDAILAVTGRLLPAPGGPALALHLLENVGGLDPKDPNPISFRTSIFPEQQHRLRTIYLPVVRSRAQPGPAELRNFFDFVPPTEMTGQRPSTSVATQALFLLNSGFMKTHAGHLAEWALGPEGLPDRERMTRLYQRVLQRAPEQDEIHRAERFLAEPPPEATHPQRAAWTELCHALLCSNEFLFKL